LGANAADGRLRTRVLVHDPPPPDDRRDVPDDA